MDFAEPGIPQSDKRSTTHGDVNEKAIQEI
jgi:hypothetical protein